MSAEEAVRGYTTWSAFAGFDEGEAGVLAVGKRADFTVMTVDPFRDTPASLLRGDIALTVSRGRISYRR